MGKIIKPLFMEVTMKRKFLIILVLLLPLLAFCKPPVWSVNHNFTGSLNLFVPSMRGFSSMVETFVDVYYYDGSWKSAGGGRYNDLRIYKFGGTKYFAGSFGAGSYSDGIWYWKAGTSHEVSIWIYMVSFLDVNSDGSVWLAGSGLGQLHMKIYGDTSWTDLSHFFDTLGKTPMKGIIVSPDTICVLTSTSLGLSYDGGRMWKFVLESVFATDFWSPYNMTFDYVNRKLCVSCWGGIIKVNISDTTFESDTACGEDNRDIRIIEFPRGRYLVVKNSRGLMAKYLSGVPVLWENWRSSLPRAEIVGFGAKAGGGAAALMATGDIYFADSLETDDINEVPRPEQLSITISPNPFNSSCMIDVSTGADIVIFDLCGNKIWQTKVHESPVAWKPMENLASGVYLLKVTYNNSAITKKLIYLQ